VTSDQSPPPAAWLPVSGGLFRDALIHDFDVLRWVTGREVVDVYAAGSDAGPAMFRAAGDVDTAAAVLTLDDGVLATATATRLNGAGYDVRMELAGELDQVVVGLDDRTPIASTEPTGPPAADKPWTGFLERFAPAYEAELNAFVDVVRGGRPNPCDGREALQALRMAEACELSRRERRAVALAEIPGAQETSAATGAPGAAEPPDMPGTAGTPGVAGTAGSPGTARTPGTQGAAGPPGAQGIPGAPTTPPGAYEVPRQG
jgi:myo-inositol 2-dehydrogenase/D-chiro-inositol 1-dehydrogenase